MLKINKSKANWEEEYLRGDWDKFDDDPLERKRQAMIGSFCRDFYPPGKILDVGCGFGTLVDFLNPAQVKNYLGLDVSEEAIKRAKLKRLANFKSVAWDKFKAQNKFDIIVFNEIIYYLDTIKTLKKSLKLLNSDGLVIISLSYRDKNERGQVRSKKIWEISQRFLKTVKETVITGEAGGEKFTWQIKVLKRK